MIIQNKTRRIIREIAEITGLSFNQVRDIALCSQFKYVVNEINRGTPGEADTFKNVMVRYLGTFESSPGRIFHLTEAKKRKIEKENEEKHNGTIQSED